MEAFDSSPSVASPSGCTCGDSRSDGAKAIINRPARCHRTAIAAALAAATCTIGGDGAACCRKCRPILAKLELCRSPGRATIPHESGCDWCNHPYRLHSHRDKLLDGAAVGAAV